ncbi:SinI family autotransporter-associated protein [Budvicia aquatica]|uniref:Ornithine carbamoyltransferase n=1 Tax=Budvicia aquatica TaxID=82979 RepID=A0A2C6DV76_9GAMM|nr:SinI family autotransporter-associated protein [Budvicia aquatica]PHI32232.1 ornithine carbamoyltransferase [Budvicia aquatica]
MNKKQVFTLKKLVLSLVLAGCTISSAQAVITGNTGSIQGRAPILVAPSAPTKDHSVDFSGTYATAGKLTVGDTIVLKYNHKDLDGDADDSALSTRVIWSFSPSGGGTDITIASTGVAATAGAPVGTSTVVLPAAALNAAAIKVTIQEYSKSGDPINGQSIVVTDTGSLTGGGGGEITPPGPVLPNFTTAVAGIYLSTDTSFSNNLIGATATKLTVGQTYVFKLWSDAARTADITNTVNYNWRLTGDDTKGLHAAPGSGFVTSVSGTKSVPANFIVPVNGHADGTALTGSADGAQGYALAVDYNN